MVRRYDYKICPYCGASLDVGEQCDCRQKKQPPELTHSGLLRDRQYKHTPKQKNAAERLTEPYSAYT